MVGGVITKGEGNAWCTSAAVCINQLLVVGADVATCSVAIATTVAGIEMDLLQMIFAMTIGMSSQK